MLAFLLVAPPANAEATLKTNPTGYAFEPFTGFLPDIGWVVGLKTVSDMTVTFDGYENEDRLQPGDIVQTVSVYRPQSRQKVSVAEIVPDELLAALDAAALDHGIFVRFVRNSDGWKEMRREFTSVGTRKERRRAASLEKRIALHAAADEERKRQLEEERQRLAALRVQQRRATGQCIEQVTVNVMHDYANDRGCAPATLKADVCDKILYLESWITCGIFEDPRFSDYRHKYGYAP